MGAHVLGVCECGAVTVEGTDGDEFSNCMTRETLAKEFPDLEVSDDCLKWCNCNHCVNGWGLDLCGCGSGEPLGECEEGLPECESGVPSQTKGEPKDSFGWGAAG
jgi:hypothetical protein